VVVINRQTRSTKTLKETKKEDKEEGRDCSQPTKGKKRDQKIQEKM